LSPTGAGTFVDVPSPGTLGNPSFFGSAPWGGGDAGCLLAGELNSHWIIFTIATNGTLAFSFGQNSNGGQFGFYDWSMWPYNGPSTCADIANNLVAPARCLWNATTTGGTGLAAPVPAGGSGGNYGPPLNVVAGQQFIICLSNYSFVTANVVLDFFGTAAIQCASVLGSESITLEAKGSLCHDLQWTSATEVELEAYEVHRSANGQVWEVVGDLRSGLLTTSQIRQPYYGSNYYRIKGYHPDGSYLFSNTAYMEYQPHDVIIFPNPCSDHMIVRGEAGGYVQIKDLLGQTVATQWLNEQGELVINTSEWPVGVYCVVTDFEREKITKKILVEH
jgi:Secretion system C-terminal sorting domain